jgi:hypothetical protein
MRLKIHWLLESFIFWVLFIIIYLILDDVLTTKSNGIISFLSWIVFAMPIYLIIIFSFYLRHQLSSTNVIINIIILQISPIVYFIYNFHHSSEQFINKLIRDFPLNNEWLLYLSNPINSIFY